MSTTAEVQALKDAHRKTWASGDYAQGSPSWSPTSASESSTAPVYRLDPGYWTWPQAPEASILPPGPALG